jgi:hypothetical protein
MYIPTIVFVMMSNDYHAYNLKIRISYAILAQEMLKQQSIVKGGSNAKKL